MASQQWDSDWGDNNAQNSHPKDATYRRKSYEPFRCVLSKCTAHIVRLCLIGGESHGSL